MTRVLVADNDDTIREGIYSVLDRQSLCTVFHEARTPVELVDHLKRHDYDLIVLEPCFAKKDNEDVIKSARENAPQSNILVFTRLDELTHGVRAIRCGAKGYLMKTCSISEFLKAARQVSNGKFYVSAALAVRVASHPKAKSNASPYKSLTRRELEVYSMLVCGKRVVEIANLLKLSPKTVSTHKKRIISKFACKSLSEIVNHAISLGLVDDCRTRVANTTRSYSRKQTNNPGPTL